MGQVNKSATTPAASKTSEVMHTAARWEDRYHRFREKRARKRNYAVTVVPYPGYGSTEWVRVLARVLLTRNPRPGSRQDRKMQKRSESVRGWRSFIAVPVKDAVVTIKINGYTETVKADRGGVIDVSLPVKLKPGRHTVHVQAENSEVAEATIYVVDPQAKFGIICDVDDTVMVTALPRPFVAAWNSFVLDEHARLATPGMNVLVNKLLDTTPGMPLIYLSTGAWNIAPTLDRFLERNFYPHGSMLLTDWGPTHDRMFRSGVEHKRTQLRRLAKEFPQIKWILIGDDGQHDETTYGDFEDEYPQNVAAVLIRQLTYGEAVFAGGRKKAEINSQRGQAPWVYAPDGAGLAAQLPPFVTK
jgi:phosphatidate phosphatase APP1